MLVNKRADAEKSLASMVNKPDVLDETGQEDAAVHATRQSKWAKEAGAGVREDLFFVVLPVSRE
eukprot:7822808-Pyramimonas_sp.AAC.1